jgi:hypothetical protein
MKRLRFYRSYIDIINIRELSYVSQNPEIQRNMCHHELIRHARLHPSVL